MRLTSVADVSGRKGAPLRRISMTEVEGHKTEYDAWTYLCHGKAGYFRL
jgi:hypothetical protein